MNLLYQKPQRILSENLIFLDGFSVVHITFARIVKFKLLIEFLMDHRAHTVVCSLIFSQCYFAAFAYYVIDHFVSITTVSTSILLRLVYSCFYIVSPYGVVLCCYMYFKLLRLFQ